MAYYTSETCGFSNGSYRDVGCITDYSRSEVKNVVDAWKNENASLSAEARLITYDELTTDLGCTNDMED